MMPSLSRSILLYDWKRFLTAVIALGFSAFLIYAQVGLALMIFGLENAFLVNSQTDLWVTSGRDVKTFFWHNPINRNVELALRMHPDVMMVQSMWLDQSRCRIAGRNDAPGAVVTPIDINNNYLCVPDAFIKEFGLRLEEPLAVVVDASGAKALGLRVGDSLEINNKKVRVVGITAAYDGTLIPFFFASEQTFNYMFPERSTKYFDFLLLKLRDPTRAEAVRAELMTSNGAGKDFQVWTTAQLYWKSLYFWLFFNDESLVWIFLVLLSLGIGTIITSQTLRAAILATLREYAALRALGLSRPALRGIVLEQTCWVGGAGLVLGLGMTWLFSWSLSMMKMNFYIPWWFMTGVALLVMGAALMAGLLAIRVLYQTQPAELLR